MRTTYKHLLTLCAVIILFIGVGFSIMPTKVRAADPCTEDGKKGNYCLLEPLPIGTSGTTFSEYNPKSTSAADYINLMIKVFIGIIGVLGAVMIVLGGIQYMTTDAVSKKEGGKEMITNSIFGLILALASWVILNTINPHLIEIHIDPPKGKPITVKDTDTPPGAAAVTVTRNGQTVSIQSHCDQTSASAANQDGVELTDGAAWDSVQAIHDNDARYRTQLTSAGVVVNGGGVDNAPDCATVGSKGCTTVYKLGNTAVINLGKLQTAVCGSDTSCKLRVTGGTECWLHSSHQIGSGRVDIGLQGSTIDAYVKKATKTCIKWIDGQSSDGCGSGQAGMYMVGTTMFVRESDHYHIQQW